MKVALAVAFSLAVLLLLVSRQYAQSRDRPIEWHALSPSSLRIIHVLIAYGAVLFLASLQDGVPRQRQLALGEVFLALIALLLLDRTRPGRFARVIMGATVIHVAVAIIIGDRALATTQVDRLTGGSHPILIGFEAGMLLVTAVPMLWDRATHLARTLAISVALLATYGLLASFSRTAIISTALGLTLLLSIRSRRHPAVRVLLAIAIMAVAGYLVSDNIERFLGRDDVAGLGTVTGRVFIWQRLVPLLPREWANGIGFAPLTEPRSAIDMPYSLATSGQPTENAAINAYLMGGLLALALFAVAVGVLLVQLSRYSRASRGTTGAVAVLLAGSVLVSDGASGTGFQFWWVLASVSLVNLVSSRVSKPTHSLVLPVIQTKTVRGANVPARSTWSSVPPYE